MGGWEFATIYETVADHVPEAIAQRQGAHATSFRDFDRRADGVAAWLLSLGVAEQDRFAQFLFNGPEYLESVFAAYKVGLVPVNTNYRYGADEIGYLWDNAEPAAVVFHGSLTPVVETVRHRLASVRGWLFVDDAATDCPDWATPYETVATTPAPRQRAPWGRDGDQLCLLYTGGTTGLPKGVMWRQDDVAVVMPSLGPFSFGSEPDYDALASTLGSGQQLLAACPLMHGTALFTSHAVLAQGGSVATLASRRFDALELLDDVARHRVAAVILVGDAFARPILEALEASPGRWDLSSLTAIGSSGPCGPSRSSSACSPTTRRCCCSTRTAPPRRCLSRPRSRGSARSRRRRRSRRARPRSCSATTGGPWRPAQRRWAWSPWAGGSRSATSATTRGRPRRSG